jgi:3-dehydroquinate dehydratase / shikimate dehydrogenase
VATISSLSQTDLARNCPDWRFADWLEIRADLLPEPIGFRPDFGGRLLYSLRSCRAGGRDDSPIGTRRRRLRGAARLYDLVDLECDRDLVPDLLSTIDPERRVISWHGRARDDQDLLQLLQVFSRTEARLYRFAVDCSSVEEGITALRFLNRAQRSDVIAYATGPLGLWTRILAPRLGAPIIFGGLQDESEDGGCHLSVSELIQDYGFPEIRPVSEIFAIVGEPVSNSLSPRLHNAAHRAAGAGRVFLSFPTKALDRLWSRLISSGNLETMGLTIKGLTVASPNKQSALRFSERVAPLCHRCQASNLLVRANGDWAACTTDPAGIFDQAILRQVKLSGARAAVVGCGGSGRVTAAALVEAGAEVTLVNRGFDRGRWAGHLLGLPFVPLPEFSLRGFSILVNATPVGRNGEELPVDLKGLDPGSLVVDLVYRRKGATPLATAAQALSHKVVDGRKVLLGQTMRQYLLMTGEPMPETLARGLLGLPTAGKGSPGSDGASPYRAGADPGSDGASPYRAGADPGSDGASPYRAGANPGSDGASPYLSHLKQTNAPYKKTDLC